MNETLRYSPDVSIIGINRGENNLVYYSLINSKGEIMEQGSLNIIKTEQGGIKSQMDYHAKLVDSEKARDAARKSWHTIGKIKDLKDGYISQVVHKIAQLMIKHNAIVAIEDLNFDFKRGRMKVERQVYQKLEKMLIDKLNYLVFKDNAPYKPGGVLNAYQLTMPFKSFVDMGKQTGFVFYVSARHTTRIDYSTGFINLLPAKYDNAQQAKAFLGRMDAIRYNNNEGYFEFAVDYDKFIPEKAGELGRSQWTICTQGDERYYYDSNKKTYLRIDVTENIKTLLRDNNIPFGHGTDIKNDILTINDTNFYRDMIFYLRLVLQMHYTDGKGKDYILSPVAGNDGTFFDSRASSIKQPVDGDANGAYHVALKGLLQLHKIKQGSDKLAISNKEWLEFAQQQQYRNGI